MLRCFDTCLTDADAQVVADQIKTGMVGPGKAVAEFEAALREYIGVGSVVCCSSGSVALLVSLMAMDLTPRSRVAFPAYGHPAGAHAARILGHEVVLYDVGLNGCPQSGKYPPCDFKIGISFNGMSHLPSGFDGIEDAAQSLGCSGCGWHSRHAATLSFSPQKLVATGQGGAIIPGCFWPKITENMVRGLIDQGGDWRKDRKYKHIGSNFRMSDVNAVLGLSQMRRIKDTVARREELHGWYRNAIPLPLLLNCGWSVIVETRLAKTLIKRLAEIGVEATQPYRAMNEHFPYYKPKGSFPNAERLAQELVYLPGHLNVTKEDVWRIATVVNEVAR